MTGTVLGAVDPVVTSLGEVLSQHSPGPSLEALLVAVGSGGCAFGRERCNLLHLQSLSGRVSWQREQPLQRLGGQKHRGESNG